MEGTATAATAAARRFGDSGCCCYGSSGLLLLLQENLVTAAAATVAVGCCCCCCRLLCAAANPVNCKSAGLMPQRCVRQTVKATITLSPKRASTTGGSATALNAGLHCRLSLTDAVQLMLCLHQSQCHSTEHGVTHLARRINTRSNVGSSLAGASTHQCQMCASPNLFTGGQPPRYRFCFGSFDNCNAGCLAYNSSC